MQVEAIETETATETRARFTIAARPLADAVKLLASKVTESRCNIPILATLLIEAAPCGAVTLTATDLDLWATVTLQADPSEAIEPGALCLDADNLAKMLAQVAKNADRVRIEVQEPEARPFDSSARNKPAAPRAILKASRNEYKLRGLPCDQFPMPKAADVECAGVIGRGQFLRDLKALAPAASTEETRYYLNGYALQVRELGGRDRFAMVATNGWAAAAASRPIPAGLEGWQDAILPRKLGAVMIAADKVAGEGESITLSRLGMMVQAEFGAVRIVSKLIDGTFPQWPVAFERIATPTADSCGPMFPDLLPGRPTGAMEKLTKAAPVAIDWQQGEGGMMGEAAGDPDLLYVVTEQGQHGAPIKGYAYEYSGHGEAKAYLQALAAAAGLPSAEDMQARADAVKTDSDWQAGRHVTASYFGDGQLIMKAGRIVGLTVEGKVTRYAWRETVKDWEALCERYIDHPETVEPLEGSYSVVMPAHGPQLVPEHSVTVAGDTTYPIASNGAKIHLSKDQVAALCGDDLWAVLEFPGADGRPRYVSQWLWDDGATRLLIVGKDGRCPKAGAPREYVTREQVEAALAGEIAAPVVIEAPAPIAAEPVQLSGISGQFASACQMPEDCADAMPAPTDSADAPASNPTPVSCQPADDGDPIAAVRARLAEIEAILAALPAQSARPKRTPAHERAIRRAWAERKARRCAEQGAAAFRQMLEVTEAAHKRAEHEITVRCDQVASLVNETQRLQDRAGFAEQEAADALAAREDLQRVLADAEARLAAAEAENAQLWAEIETLTAPQPALAA